MMYKLLLVILKGWTLILYLSLPLHAQYLYQWQIGSEALGFNLMIEPISIAIDGNGDVYVVEIGKHQIQKFSSGGRFLFKFGSYGQGEGQFSYPKGIAVDASGNIYVADNLNDRIQKFTSDGIFLSTFGSKGSGDGQFLSPRSLTLDKDGNVYVVDMYNHRIQKFTSDGTFLFKFGSFGQTNGQFSYPRGVAVDTAGNIYVADGSNPRVQKFSADGTYLLQFGTFGDSDGQISNHYGVAVDAQGSVYVTEPGKHRIQKYSADGALVSSLGSFGSDNGLFKFPAGIAIDEKQNVYVADYGNHRIQKFSGDASFQWMAGGIIENGQFYFPYGIAVDKVGNIYIADENNHRIQKFAADGTFLLKFGVRGYEKGQLYHPRGIAVDTAGNIYVAANINPRIQKFSADGTFIFEFGSFGDGDGQFKFPASLAVDREGNIYVADVGNHRIQKFSADGTFLSKFGNDNIGTRQFSYPYGMALGADNNIYVIDNVDACIQKFSPEGTFLSKLGSFGSDDGEFIHPFGVTVDVKGNIYVVDTYNHRIQKFASDGAFLSKFGSFGSGGGQFNLPTSAAVDTKGNIYVTDRENHRIQKFTPYSREVLLFSDSVSGYPKEEVEVQVRANDFTDIISAQATLEWDPQVAELLSAEAVALSQVQFNTQTANQGKMTFSWYESSDAEGLSLPDSAVLFTLRFRLIGKPKAKTALSFTSSLTPLEFADKEEKIVKVTTQAGKVYILPLQTLSGRILTEASQAVKDVEVKLSGYASAVDSTDAEGKYQLSGIHPYKSYSITASKDHNAIFANGLTSLDLAILQRHILETELLASPYKLLAADVDLSQSITTADIKDVQDVVLGNRDRLAKGKHWTFIPKRFVFEDPAYPYPFDTAIVFDTVPVLSGHDFVAIKLGDVNDTWDPAKGRLQQKQLKFFVEQHETFSHGTLTIPIKVADFKNVSSFQLTLEWDEEILAFESAQGDALPDVVFGEKYVQEGQLTVLWYNMQGSSSSLSDEQAAFTVNFQAVGKTGEQSAVSLSSARTPLLAYDAANVLMKTEITAGVVEITEAFNPARPTVYNLHQNEPNPFTDEVRLKFALPQKSKVNLKVMNASGQVFFQTEDTFDQGTHAISWDGRTAQGATLNPGVYFLQLTAGSFQETIKIIKK